jgi:hypothetical protein
VALHRQLGMLAIRIQKNPTTRMQRCLRHE